MTETATPDLEAAMPTATITRFRYLGVTDECVVCQKCGKPNLKSTVVLAVLDAEGNTETATYYGSSCAARALGETGRGAAARVLGLARGAHRSLVAAAWDGRQMLGGYSLPEIGAATDEQLDAAALRYAEVHRNAVWAPQETAATWRVRVIGMLRRYQAAIADAVTLGVTVPVTQREYDRFVNTF